MAGEREIAKDVLSTIAKPIATQAVEFGNKLAIGTGAALVLIVSQLGDLKDFVPPIAIFASCVLAAASLLLYMAARWSCIQFTVLDGARLKLVAITYRPAPDGFDKDNYFKESLALSVWPASWLIRRAMRRGDSTDSDVVIIHYAQKVTRYVALQALTMFAALLVLIVSFTFNDAAQAAPAEKSQPAINYSRVDCAAHTQQPRGHTEESRNNSPHSVEREKTHDSAKH